MALVSRWLLPCAGGVVGGMLLLGLTLRAESAPQQDRSADALTRDGTAMMIDPVRTKTAAPQGPPSLPAAALTFAPATVEMRIETGQGVRRQRVTRTADRVHLASGGEREWLYVRNPVDPRRATGMLVDHRQRVVVVYEDSDLRNHLGIRGWLDVITLGFDASLLESMRPTGKVRRSDGLAFSRYLSEQPEGEIEQVWWNESALVPLEVVRRGTNGRRRTSVRMEAYKSQIDPHLLLDPAARFADYRQIDFPDWLEGLDER